MSMTDPVADMLTRIRNAQMAEKLSVSMPSSEMAFKVWADKISVFPFLLGLPTTATTFIPLPPRSFLIMVLNISSG